MSATPQSKLLRAYRKLLAGHPATAKAHRAALAMALRGHSTRGAPRKYGIGDLWGTLLTHIAAGVLDRSWQTAAREYYRRKGDSKIDAERKARGLLNAWGRGTAAPRWVGERWVYVDADGREHPVGRKVARRAGE